MNTDLNGKKCVIFTAQNHHVAKTTAIVKELEKLGVEMIYITSQNGNNEYTGDFELPLINREIKYLSLSDFISNELLIKIGERARECQNIIWQCEIESKECLPSYFSDHGLNNAIYESSENIVLIEAALTEIKPDFNLVLYEGNFWTKAFCCLSNKLNIPVFSFQEGSYSKEEMILPSVGRIIAEFSSKLFLWGNESKESLTQSIENPSKLIVAGAPHTDELHLKMLNFSREKFNQQYSLQNNKKNILLIMPSIFPSFYGAVKNFNQIINEIGHSGIIKFRPAGNFDEFLSLKKQFESENLLFFYDEDIIELILGSDLAISGNSTAGFESVLLEKPLIYLDDKQSKDMHNLKTVAFGSTFLENDVLETITLLQNSLDILPEEILFRTKDYLNNIIYKFDGKSCSRIANLIAQELNK